MAFLQSKINESLDNAQSSIQLDRRLGLLPNCSGQPQCYGRFDCRCNLLSVGALNYIGLGIYNLKCVRNEIKRHKLYK